MANVTKILEEQLQELGSRLALPHGSAEELFSLLDRTDQLLESVDQSPSESLLTALKPLMSALVEEELLRHSDTDVKVAVASCISEITRITAPEAPYEDDKMKEIFQMIVGAFEGLYDTSNRSFVKRVSILETVAKVRSCVVMLDLECDDLVLQMFHHFLKTISLNHSETVFSSMETIMSLVIDESEEISPELLSCLLDVVKKDNKDVLPIAQKLVEQVIVECANKLKPCLVEFVQSTGASLSDYNKIVSSICHENSDALENTETNTLGETMAEDSKLSERTVSDEVLQLSTKLEQEVCSPEKDGIVADNSPKVASNNVTFQLGNCDSIAQPVYPNQMPEGSCSGQSKDAIAASIADDGNVESVSIKPGRTSDLDTKKEKDRKTNSSAQLTDTADHSRVENDREAPAVSGWRQGQSKETDHSVDLSEKEDVSAVVLDHDTSNGQRNNSLVESSTPHSTSQGPNKILPESTRSKRGRPAGRKSTAKQNDGDLVDHRSPSASGQKNLPQDEEILVKDDKSKKESESINDSEGKSRSQAGKKSQLKTAAAAADSPVAVTSDTEIKTQSYAGKKGVKRKVSSRESSREKHKSNVKQKEQVSLEEDAAGEPSSKEIVLSPRNATKATSIDENQLEDSKKPASRKKRSQGAEQIPETSDRKKMGDDIVGSRIKVWWPDDETFYDGVIDSFDQMTMKHKVVYTDGDVEILSLSNERWEFTGGDIEGIEKAPEDTDSVQMTNTKMGRGTPSSLSKPAKTPLQSKSGAESNDKSGKRRKGRPPSGASNLEKDDGSSLTSRKSKGRAAVSDKAKTPTSSSKLKDEPEKSGSMDATTKTSKARKSGDGSKDGGKKKGNTAKIGASSKHALTRSGRKSKTPKPGEETSKSGGGKSGFDDDGKSSEVTPKTGTQSEVDVAGAETQPKTQKTSRTKKLNKPISQAPNGAASKEKVKLQENENTDGAKVGASSGAKRGRKRRKT